MHVRCNRSKATTARLITCIQTHKQCGPQCVQLRSLQLEGHTPCVSVRIRAASAAFPSIHMLCAQRITLRKKSKKERREGRKSGRKVGQQPLLNSSLLLCPSAESHSEACGRLLSCLGYRNLQGKIQISGTLESNQPGANPRSTSYWLCVLGKIKDHSSFLRLQFPICKIHSNIC